MTLSDITTGEQTVTTTGAVTPTAGLDISGISGDFTIFLVIRALTSAKTCRIQLEDSVNAFTAAIALWVQDFIGPQTSATDLTVSIRKYQLPNNRFGTSSAVLRANVTAIDSATSLTLHAWLVS